MTEYTTAPVRVERDRNAPINTLAIVGFILAFFVTVAAIVLGFIALAQIKQTGERGRGLALAAVILGFVFSVFWIVATLALIAIPVFLGSNQAAEDAVTETDLANAKVVMLTYAADNNGIDPADVDTLEGAGFKPSGGTVNLRLVGGGAGGIFCIEGLSRAGNAFHVSQSAGVESGLCAG